MLFYSLHVLRQKMRSCSRSPVTRLFLKIIVLSCKVKYENTMTKVLHDSEDAPKAALRKRTLRSSLTAKVLLFMVCSLSAWGLYRDFKARQSPLEVVFWYGWMSAVATGLGAIPFLLSRGESIDDKFLGICNAIAAGMMITASASLAWEAYHDDTMAAMQNKNQASEHIIPISRDSAMSPFELNSINSLLDDPFGDGSALFSLGENAGGIGSASTWHGILESAWLSIPTSNVVRLLFGIVTGLFVIYGSKKVLDKCEDISFGDLRGASARRVLLILSVMTLHSATEGIGIGVSFGSSDAPVPSSSTPTSTPTSSNLSTLGRFISLTIAIHNIPEGLATCLVLIPNGTPPIEAALWAMFTSFPQPLFALPSFLAVSTAAALLCVGLGFAAGAMLYVAVKELIPEAVEAIGKPMTLAVATVSAFVMFGFQHAIA